MLLLENNQVQGVNSSSALYLTILCYPNDDLFSCNSMPCCILFLIYILLWEAIKSSLKWGIALNINLLWAVLQYQVTRGSQEVSVLKRVKETDRQGETKGPKVIKHVWLGSDRSPEQARMEESVKTNSGWSGSLQTSTPWVDEHTTGGNRVVRYGYKWLNIVLWWLNMFSIEETLERFGIEYFRVVQAFGIRNGSHTLNSL